MSNIRCQKALSLAYLQPKEESFGASFKLKHKNTARGALIDPLELTVIRKNDQVLVKGTMKILLFLRSALQRNLEFSMLFIWACTNILHIPCGSVLPAEVDERIVCLLNVHKSFALIRGHGAALQGHFSSTELYQVFAWWAPGSGHQAREQSSRRHL